MSETSATGSSNDQPSPAFAFVNKSHSMRCPPFIHVRRLFSGIQLTYVAHCSPGSPESFGWKRCAEAQLNKAALTSKVTILTREWVRVPGLSSAGLGISESLQVYKLSTRQSSTLSNRT